MEERKLMTPLGDRVLITKHIAKDKTESGIIVPDSAKKDVHKGTILRVGHTTLSLKVGQVIHFIPFSGYFVDPDDETLIILNGDDIIASE